MKNFRHGLSFEMTRSIIKCILMAKMVIILIISFSLQSFAKGYAQGSINLQLQNVPIKQVLKAIESQGTYRFVYKDQILPKSQRVSISVKNASLEEVLMRVLKDTKLKYKELNNNLVVITDQSLKTMPGPFLQEVRGKITDQAGKPLGGVSITEKGTNNGTVSAEDGSFVLLVTNLNAILEISYVGYVSYETGVNVQGPLNIQLASDERELSEVVVIGYGERSRRDVTGAVASVGSRDIEKSTSMTPELAMQGRMAGVFVSTPSGSPFARPTVRIRGVNSFASSNDPLYVIDGVPVTEGGAGITGGALGDIRTPINIYSMINPNDIESITVLKDASSAAIYGVRAANGVVLITTKKGKSGKPKVEITSSYGWQNIPKTVDVLNTSQYMALYKEAYNNNPNINSGVPVPFEDVFGELYNEASPQYPGNGPTYDWQGELLNKNAVIQDYTVRLSGGSEATTYYVSAGFGKTESPLKGNHLTRYTLTANINSKISKYVETGVTMRLNRSNALDNTRTDLGSMTTAPPFQPIYDTNDPTGYAAATSAEFVPNPGYDPNLLNPGPRFNFAPGSPRSLWGPATRFNPFAAQALNQADFDLYRVLGDAFLVIQPVKGIRIKGLIGGDLYFNNRREWTNYDTYRFSQTPGNPYAGHDGTAVGRYGERNTKNSNLVKELTVNLNKTLFKEHSFDIVLGTSEQEWKWSVNDLSSGQINYTDPNLRGIPNLPPYTSGFSGLLSNYSLVSYFGRMSYKLKDRYYVDATLRRDGSSRFAPGKNRWGTFPSIGVAWRISDEPFFTKVPWLSDLKLRAGWGQLGNDQNTGGFAYLSSVGLTPDYSVGSGNGDPFGAQQLGARLPNFPNLDLSWETLETSGIGFDALLFNNKVNLTIEYYNKNTNDIIQGVQLAPSTGIEFGADLNIGKVRNRGFEFDLGYTNKLGPVNFNVSGNFTTVSNEVIKLNLGSPIGGENGRIEEGYSIGYLWGYQFGGIFQNQAEIDRWRTVYADLNVGQNPNNPTAGNQPKPGDAYFLDVYGNPRNNKEFYSDTPDSLINSNDRTYLGRTIPGYFYGFNFSLNYKNFDLGIFFQGIGNVKKFNSLRAGGESMSSNGANQWASTQGRWTTQNQSTTMPRAVYNDPLQNNRFSSRFVENAGFLRLKNLQLGYVVPKNITRQWGFVDGLRIYFSGINLLTFTDWTGIDPENDFVPPTRQILFGVNASF